LGCLHRGAVPPSPATELPWANGINPKAANATQGKGWPGRGGIRRGGAADGLPKVRGVGGPIVARQLQHLAARRDGGGRPGRSHPIVHPLGGRALAQGVDAAGRRYHLFYSIVFVFWQGPFISDYLGNTLTLTWGGGAGGSVQSATHKKRDGCWGGLTNPKTGFVEKWGHWDDFARVSLFGRATDSLKAGRLTFYGNARGKSRKSHTVDLGVDLGYWQRMTPPLYASSEPRQNRQYRDTDTT